MGYVNYIPDRQCLVVNVDKKKPYDLALLLKEYKVKQLAIHGAPVNVQAISDYRRIVDIHLTYFEHANLAHIRGLTKLKRFDAAFGQLSDIELDFCSSTLEVLILFKLTRVKDLSRLTRSPMPKLKLLNIDSIRNYKPPDWRLFPNLTQLAIRNTNWPSLKWLSKLPRLESISIWGNKIADGDWRPLVKLPRLKAVHGLPTVLSAADRKEFMRLRPDIKLG